MLSKKKQAGLLTVVITGLISGIFYMERNHNYQKIGYEIIQVIPQDKCFTQGLYIQDYIYESCGLYGKSKIRKIDVDTNKLLLTTDFSFSTFAEGLTSKGDYLYLFTWLNESLYVLNKKDLSIVDEIKIKGEWWGLTNNEEYLLASNGSHYINYITFDGKLTTKKLKVNGLKRHYKLNELEYIDGNIFANIYDENFIIKIDENNGNVLGYINFENIVNENKKNKLMVLNGIARFPNGNYLITGKDWDKKYIIKLDK